MYRRFHARGAALDFIEQYNTARKDFFAKLMTWPYAHEGMYSVFVPLAPNN